MYGYSKHYNSVNELIKSIDQYKVFEYCGIFPELGKFYTNPLREDSSPRCFFHESWNGILYFKDFTKSVYHHPAMNCVIFFSLKFNITVDEAKFRLQKMDFSNLNIAKPIISKRPKKAKSKISYQRRIFNKHDKHYWSKYGITETQLIEDEVYPIECALVNGNFISYNEDSYTFVIDEWEDALKICSPKKKQYKWMTSTTKNHIGFLKKLPFAGELLIITKAYKDARVLFNQGFDVIWLQNEGMMPKKSLLFSIIRTFNKVIVLFDNDAAGIKNGNKLCNIINKEFPNKAKFIHVPITKVTKLLKITDPSDLISYSKKQFNKFIKSLK